jgi:ribosomal protein S17
LNPISPEIGMIFDNYDLAERFFDQYAKSNGFVIIKGQIEKDKTDKSIIVRRSFECHHGRIRKSKKVIDLMQQRNRQSEKINCPWVCNVNRIKNTDSVKITSFINRHNHDCNNNVAQYAPKYRKLPSNILDDIRFFTLDGHMGAGMQYRLLSSKYPDIYIHKRDLYNTIYRFKATTNHQRHGDGQSILNKLLELQHEEPGWIIKTRLEGPVKNLIRVLSFHAFSVNVSFYGIQL